MNEQECTPNVDDSAPAVESADSAFPRHINSVDATSGQPIVARVLARKTELLALLDGLPADDVATKGDIELALSTINDLLTGDLDNVPSVVASNMNRWLERNKHLAERAAPAATAVDPVEAVESARCEP